MESESEVIDAKTETTIILAVATDIARNVMRALEGTEGLSTTIAGDIIDHKTLTDLVAATIAVKVRENK